MLMKFMAVGAALVGIFLLLSVALAILIHFGFNVVG